MAESQPPRPNRTLSRTPSIVGAIARDRVDPYAHARFGESSRANEASRTSFEWCDKSQRELTSAAGNETATRPEIRGDVNHPGGAFAGGSGHYRRTPADLDFRAVDYWAFRAVSGGLVCPVCTKQRARVATEQRAAACRSGSCTAMQVVTFVRLRQPIPLTDTQALDRHFGTSSGSPSPRVSVDRDPPRRRPEGEPWSLNPSELLQPRNTEHPCRRASASPRQGHRT